MIVNSNKLQVIITDKKKEITKNENVVIDNKQIKPSLELLEIQLDNKLNFSLHIITYLSLLPIS